MAIRIANNAISTLAGAIGSGDTMLSVQPADADRFPVYSVGDWSPATIVDASGNMEIVRITGRTGASMSVQRGQEGTAAKSFAAGSKIDIRLTAGVISSLQTTLDGKQAALGYTPANKAGEEFTGPVMITDDPLRLHSTGAVIWDLVAQSDTALVFMDQLGNTHFRFGTGGEFWTRQLGNLDAALSGKLPVSGGELSGPLELEYYDPSFYLHSPGIKRGRLWLDANGNLSWTDQGGTTHFRISGTGELWTQQFGDLNSRIEARALAFANDRVANMAIRRVGEGSSTDTGVIASPAGTVLTGIDIGGGNREVLRVRWHYLQLYDPVRGWMAMQG